MIILSSAQSVQSDRLSTDLQFAMRAQRPGEHDCSFGECLAAAILVYGGVTIGIACCCNDSGNPWGADSQRVN